MYPGDLSVEKRFLYATKPLKYLLLSMVYYAPPVSKYAYLEGANYMHFNSQKNEFLKHTHTCTMLAINNELFSCR